MRYLIFSDLHGSIHSAEFIIQKFQEFSCDSMICLGDVLYHGPRNDIPEGYNPKKVIELLNSYADKILCIQGNCDAEVDHMVLKFDLVKEKDITLNGLKCHLEHGHHLEEDSTEYDVVLFGHIHFPVLEKSGKTLFVNPGSITIPKNNSKPSFILWEDNTIYIYDIENHITHSYSFS